MGATRTAVGGGGRPGASEAWTDAVRVAHLLTADHGTAEELAAAALLPRARRGPAPGARDAVLTRARSVVWRHRLRRAGRRDDDAFVAAYRDLPVPGRALLVLRIAEGLDPAAAASVLGVSRGRARSVVVDALDALRPALGPPAPGSVHAPGGADAAADLDLGELTATTDPDDGGHDSVLSPADPVVGRLRSLFDELAAEPPVVADPARRLAEAARRRRGRRVSVVAGALALTVAVSGTGLAVARARAAAALEQERAERQRALDALLRPAVQGPDVATWPTRGSLAGRRDLVEQVRVAAATDEDRVLSVPFLGEVGGRAVALAVTAPTGEPAQRALVALWGEPSRPVDEWQQGGNSASFAPHDGTAVPVLSAALGTGDGRVVGVVVTLTRGVSVAWSRRPDVDRRGAVTRRYTALPLEDGVATGVWPAPASAALLRVEAGDLVAIGRVQVTEEVGSSQVPLAQTVSRSCSGRAFELLRLNLADVARGAAASVGRGQAEIARVRAVGCRAVEAHALMFVTVELSDGTEVQTEAESFREANGDGVLWGAVRPVPQGRGGTYPRFASFVDARAGLRRTVVFCAPGGATAHLVRRSVGGPAVVLAQARLAPDGIGVGRIARPGDDADQGELDIVVRDAAGAVRERVPLPPPEQWLPDRAVDGPVVPTGPGTSP